jgi:hypothetical protein
MRTIEKKIWPKYFKEITANRKHFEVRLADFKIHKGDKLIMKEWDPKKKAYTGRQISMKAGNVTKIPSDMKKFNSREDIKKYGFFIIELRK